MIRALRFSGWIQLVVPQKQRFFFWSEGTSMYHAMSSNTASFLLISFHAPSRSASAYVVCMCVCARACARACVYRLQPTHLWKSECFIPYLRRIAQWSLRSALVPKVLGSNLAFSTKHITCLFCQALHGCWMKLSFLFVSNPLLFEIPSHFQYFL